MNELTKDVFFPLPSVRFGYSIGRGRAVRMALLLAATSECVQSASRPTIVLLDFVTGQNLSSKSS